MATLEQSAEGSDPAEATDGVRRRDFLNVAAVSFAGVGVVAVALPLIVQMSPPADVLALASTEVDISKIAPGQAIKTVWRKQPVFIRNLTPKEIAGGERGAAVASCATRRRSPSAPSPGKTNWLITLGVCTHLGCVPLGTGEGENRGPFGGYFCPCHGSAYDTAARIRRVRRRRTWWCRTMSSLSDTTVQIG